tara:strand:- start:187 stop:621 length:435 start_codon:yes stop_codon:yes gene_type:complete
MIGYKIHKQDIQKLENKLNKIDLKVIGDLEKEFGITASMIQVRAKKDAPVDTGFLKSSINFGKTSKGVFVQASAKYSAAVEFGTKPHKIRAKNKSVLYSSKTKTFFGKEVNHPGTKGQPFFFDNAKIEIRQLLKRLENKIKRLL